METWVAKVEEGDGPGAWDDFLSRYRSVVLGTIRRVVDDPDDTMDVFSATCQAFVADDFARLRAASAVARCGTHLRPWIVTVVRRLAIDWRRRQEGRRRVTIPPGLKDLQRSMFTLHCIEGRSLMETFELLRSRGQTAMPFHLFLREAQALGRITPCPGSPVRPRRHEPLSEDLAVAGPDLAVWADTAQHLQSALEELPPDVRLAISLFVVDGMAAAEVAGIVGWSGAKAVYNRVYRALGGLRERLLRAGVSADDLS
jgi:RNA polymerase sigma factor (sigma-70 family)